MTVVAPRPPGPADGLPTDGWFDTAPPDGYKQLAGGRRGDDEVTALIVVGLRTYAEKTGHYPRVRHVYGDQLGDELARLLGRKGRHDGGSTTPADRPFDPADPRELFGAATCGIACLNGLQRQNPARRTTGRRSARMTPARCWSAGSWPTAGTG